MQINTKFDIGQEVWFVSRHDGIMCSVVEAILIQTLIPFTRDKESIDIEYALYSDDHIAEQHLFATKEELVNSLLA